MIQANELRIGNLLENRFSPENMDIWVMRKVDHTIFHTDIISNYYRPIPITVDLIKNCGIKIQVGDKTVGVLIELTDDTDIEINFFNEAEVRIRLPEDYISLPHIKYVHQLENLYYALTGKELEL